MTGAVQVDNLSQPLAPAPTHGLEHTRAHTQVKLELFMFKSTL